MHLTNLQKSVTDGQADKSIWKRFVPTKNVSVDVGILTSTIAQLFLEVVKRTSLDRWLDKINIYQKRPAGQIDDVTNVYFTNLYKMWLTDRMTDGLTEF